ncbi:MAG: hypothetical protein M0Z75_00720, partial [Nitrospiraceae bacterium]|nr:hypothetical protein [Nitrospiraceae bacterium]
DEFGGMHPATAYNYMLFAKKCVDLKKIREFAADNWSKVLALLHSCTEEELKEIEEKGLEGNVIGKYDGKSVREFKKILEKRDRDDQAVIREAEKAHKKEMKHLLEKIERLEPFDPENKSGDWALDQLKVVDDILGEADRALRKFRLDKRLRETPEVMAKISGLIERMRVRVEDLSGDFDAFLGEEE